MAELSLTQTHVRENPVPPKPASQDFATINQLVQDELKQTGADADTMAHTAEQSALTSGLMSIDDWIDQTLAAKGYIQAQEDREDFILRTGAGATKFNKWMKKAGLYFNKQQVAGLAGKIAEVCRWASCASFVARSCSDKLRKSQARL